MDLNTIFSQALKKYSVLNFFRIWVLQASFKGLMYTIESIQSMGYVRKHWKLGAIWKIIEQTIFFGRLKQNPTVNVGVIPSFCSRFAGKCDP